MSSSTPVSKSEKISIGVTTYDRLEMLVETVSSILAQTHENLEILIGNDNPERNLTMSDLGLGFDPRIIIVNHPKNLGEINNLNWLLKNSSGRYFTWLSDDDIIHPQHLEILARELLSREELSCTFSGYTSDKSLFEKSKEKDLMLSEFLQMDSENFILKYSDREIAIIGCYGLFKRSNLLAVGGFISLGEGFSPYSDTLIPIMLSSHSMISVTESPSVFFRAHSESLSNSFTDVRELLNAEWDFIQILVGIVSEFPTLIRIEIFKNFSSWFRDNHLTVISRGRDIGLVGIFSAWLRACKERKMVFESAGIKMDSGFVPGLFILTKHQIRKKLEF
jgi:glycosyltransferase involved in cell wall biosynthesis